MELSEATEGERGQIAWELTRLAWSSRAALAIVPLQDLLNVGKEGRMNEPGRAEGNWRWRVTDEMLSRSVFHDLGRLTETAGRLRGSVAPPDTTA